MPKAARSTTKTTADKKTAKRPAPRSAAPRSSGPRGQVPLVRATQTGKRAATRKSTSGARKSTAKRWSLRSISVDRQFDIIGVVLALVGLLTLLSLISPANSPVTGWWVITVNRLAGLGSFLLPLALIVMGVWLVLRNVERLPMLSVERMVGVTLLYLNLLAWLHLLYGGGWELAQAGEGGGYIGATFERLLVGALGLAGGWVALSAWSLIAVALSLDVSISELFTFIQKMLASLARRINRQLEASQAAREARDAQINSGAQQEWDRSNERPGLGHGLVDLTEAGHDLHPSPHSLHAAPSGELPADFQPLNTAPQAAQPDPTGAGRPSTERGRRQAPGQAQGTGSTPPGPKVTHVERPAVPWKLPDITDILDPGGVEAAKSGQDAERASLIEETLKSFGAPVKVVEIHRGPTVTQFGVEPLYLETRNGRTRVRVGKIVALADDLALALAAQRIRIQAPVPGRNYVGIEVPNLEVSRVLLRDVMESEPFKKIRSSLRFALGKDVAGHSKAYDLAAMPHLLIAGTTGSGKSVMVNSILTCLLVNNTPAELRMILVDPKRVELTGYNGIPHLLAPVVVDADQVVGALHWVQREMDARYHRFSQVGSRNINDYNSHHGPPLPYLLVLIDELADLMMLAPDETERSLSRLAQLARATGIHLVLATQRPSVDVVTGLIKANFPARIAFAVASGIDSRVILDQPGAERLLGRGDMLFQAPDAAAPVRVQGSFVSDPEIQRLVDYWRTQAYELRELNTSTPTAVPVNMDLPLNAPLRQDGLFSSSDDERPSDPLLSQATEIVRQEGKASISMLQRKLRIGYTRSARLIDQMEERGIIGPSLPTSQVREVLDLGNTNNAEAEDNISPT